MSRSVVPRGFSRFYILSLLRANIMTGKGIMDEAARVTEGSWKPSPGLVYPRLGKLLSEGLIEEVEGGYKITPAGIKILEDYENGQKEIDRGVDALLRLGFFGKFMAQDLADKLIGLLGNVREDISRFGADQKKKYRAFLEAELKRLEEEMQ